MKTKTGSDGIQEERICISNGRKRGKKSMEMKQKEEVTTEKENKGSSFREHMKELNSPGQLPIPNNN